MYKIFEEYAKKKGWYYTQKEEGQPSHYRYLNVFNSNGNKSDDEFFVNLTPQEYDYYPYLDIMRYFIPDTGYLTNTTKNIDDYISLADEKGGFLSDTINESNSDDEFKKWFDGSKITKGGRPLLVYHFNCKDSIDPYNKDRIYFTDDPTFGERYLGKDSSKEHKAFLKIINPFICTNNNLKSVMEECYTYDYSDWNSPYGSGGKSGYDKIIRQSIEDFNMSEIYERKKVFNWIKWKGIYDGVIIPYDWDGGFKTIKSFVVFDKNQIWEIKNNI